MKRFTARAVLIDLDGTLLDTVPDLAAAVNAMRAELDMTPLHESRVAAFVGKGAEVLVHRSLTDRIEGIAPSAQFEPARQSFYRHYRAVNGLTTRVFPGTAEALDLLDDIGLPFACVTNKPREFTLALLARVGLLSRFAAVVAGDDTERKKPDPEPMLAACERLAQPAHACVAIGDSEHDVHAARAAGCAVIAVTSGYNEGRPVSELEADAIVPSLLDAVRLIDTATVDAATKSARSSLRTR